MASSPTSTLVALIPAPSGYVVNFDDPQRKAVPGCFWITSIGLVLATFFYFMRVYTKVRIVKDFNAEDWCITISFFFSICTQALLFNCWATKTCMVHAWEMPISTYNRFAAITVASASLYVPCLTFAKYSLLLFYYRMSHLRWLRVVSVAVMGFITCYSIANIFALIFPCHPIAKTWDVTITEGSCINRGAVYIVTAVTNIVTDLLLLIIPIPIVWKLQMPFIQKIGLVFIFIVGSLTCITSIVRLTTLLPTLTSVDQPWAVAIPSIWAGVEANLVIICCSIPSIRLFIRHFAPRLIGEYSFSRTRATGTSGNGRNTLGSMVHDKSKARSSYGRMGTSDADVDVELQSTAPKVWSECHRASTGKRDEHVTYIEDSTPPSTLNEEGITGIIVTKTFG
ncbi:uncharacterized protein PV09_05098 [Verruconis gallopava]|uniref:Rhodopsin domain-containing protein n=1 Tax=Verruconis gallopava TaxID=253628 RepID=A0A0D1YT30_9PEZI|nr:uncharacterized protein PV09_05098 [Verruconis gallopava]KIW03797.1 hypothetical protein PV09_05098 [Verruconis gallopava]